MNQKVVDRFTLGHVVLGFLADRVDLKPGTTLALSVGWEIIEPWLKVRYPQIFPHASVDSWQNKLGDVAGVMGGYFVSDLQAK